MARKLSYLLLVGAAVWMGVPSAHAQVTGGCAVTFNGIEAHRIDSLSSPLELTTEDTLIFSGRDLVSTRTAHVAMLIGPVTVESNTTTYATPEPDFVATIELGDVSAYGVGLFRVEGTTDGCSAGVWVRVSGTFPLATLTGLTAMGLTLGGITGQLGAIASRRRWARSAAALGGIATGSGLTLIGQAFGRLQVSYASLVGMAVAIGGLGFILAALLNPAIRDGRREAGSERRLTRAGPAVPTSGEVSTEDAAPDGHGTVTDAISFEPPPADESPEPTPDDRHLDSPPEDPEPEATTAHEPDIDTLGREQEIPDEQPEEASAEPVEPKAAPAHSPTGTAPQPTPQGGPYWCYVMASTDVFDITDHTKTVAALEPGNWYLAKRTLGGWAHVVAADGIEGWVAEGAIHGQ